VNAEEKKSFAMEKRFTRKKQKMNLEVLHQGIERTEIQTSWGIFNIRVD
jgi:hypothetical protein